MNERGNLYEKEEKEKQTSNFVLISSIEISNLCDYFWAWFKKKKKERKRERERYSTQN